MPNLPDLALVLAIVLIVLASTRLTRMGDALGALLRGLWRSNARPAPADPAAAAGREDDAAPQAAGESANSDPNQATG